MKYIKLTQGKFAIVDDEDFEWLNQWKWCYNGDYAVRKSQKEGIITMHSQILNTPKRFYGDHINRDKLDNRRSNLRIVNAQQSQANKDLQSNNTSGYRGVTKHFLINKWMARIKVNGKFIYLGLFKNKKDAAIAYNKEAIKYFKEYIVLNKLEGEKPF